MLQEEASRVQGGAPHGLRMAGWSRVDTVGQIRFWYRFCPGLAV